MRLSTQALAAAGARHPWRVVGAWVIVMVLAIVAIVTFLSLTTEGNPTNNPESQRAEDAALAAFPPSPETTTTDVVVIRSEQYTVESPRFKAFVRGFVDDPEITALEARRTYLENEGSGLVSEDRHAPLIPLALSETKKRKRSATRWRGLRKTRDRSPSRSLARRRSTTTSTSSRRRT